MLLLLLLLQQLEVLLHRHLELKLLLVAIIVSPASLLGVIDHRIIIARIASIVVQRVAEED